MVSRPQTSMLHEQVLECRRMLRSDYNARVTQSLLKLAQLNLEMVKAKLLTAVGDDVPRLQGEGKAWNLLIQYIENDPLVEEQPMPVRQVSVSS